MELYLVETVATAKCVTIIVAIMCWIVSILWFIGFYINFDELEDNSQVITLLGVLAIITVGFTILGIFIPSGDAMREMLK